MVLKCSYYVLRNRSCALRYMSTQEQIAFASGHLLSDLLMILLSLLL